MPGVDTALELARMGFAVFPLAERNKSPLKGSHGYKDATTDPEAVRRLFGDAPYNVGVATGGASGNLGVVDIDVAADGSYDGHEALAEWQAEHGRLPETASVVTGRGGTHLYYRFPSGAPRLYANQNDNAHIDFRGEGGYVMAPGSVHPNGNEVYWDVDPYEWPIADADENVIAFVEAFRPAGSDRVPLELPDVVREGSRDDTLYKVACKQRGANIPIEATLAMCRELNRGFVPPLPDSIVVQKVRGAYQRHKPGTKWQREHDSVPSMRVACSYGMTAASYRARLETESVDHYTINDRQLGRIFADIHGDVLAFVPEWERSGSFAAYDGTRWVAEGAVQRIDSMVKSFVLGLQLYCSTIEDDDERRTAQGKAYQYNSRGRRESLRNDLASELVRHADEFDRDARLLNVLNATIDMRNPGNVVVRGHDPADLITKVAPVSYDPEAECPLFTRTIASAMEGDADLVGYVQRLFGIVCAGDTTRDRFYLAGTTPRSGKGTTFGALADMLGTNEASGYAVQVQPETFAVKGFSNSSGPSSDRARLEGKRLMLTSEFSDSIELDAPFLKAATGGDLIAARRMRQNERQFRLAGTIVMLTNEYPTISDPAVFESGRAVAIPFDHGVAEGERDITLRDRLRDPGELSGLLNWCIEGYRQTASPLPTPDAVAEKTRDFLLHSDQLGLYLSERIQAREDGAITAAAIFDDFKRWSPTDRTGRKEFYRLLRKHVRVHDEGTVDGKRCRSVCKGVDFVR